MTTAAAAPCRRAAAACAAPGLCPREQGREASGVAAITPQASSKPACAPGIERHRPHLAVYEAPSQELGEAPADVALAWLLHNPVVSGPIIGPRTVEQLTGSLRAVGLRLSDATLRRLDATWSGPGGEAPDADAW